MMVSGCNCTFATIKGSGILCRKIVFGTYANSADPDQTPQNAAPDQGLHCLLTGISIQNQIKMKKVHLAPLKLEISVELKPL